MREARNLPYRSGNLVLDGVIVLFLGAIGPFGLFNVAPVEQRFVYFLLTVPVITAAIYALCAVLLREPWCRRWPIWAVMAVSAFVLSPMGAALIAAWGKALFDFPILPASLRIDMLRVAISMAVFYPVHFAISRRYFGVAEQADSGSQGKPPEQAPETPLSETSLPETPLPYVKARIFNRIPLSLGEEIVSLSAQDHYVKVTTTKGSDLILSRLSDAIDELDHIEGIRIHRSHWVARNHAHMLTRLDGKPALQLADGRLLPVAQARLKAVKSFLA